MGEWVSESWVYALSNVIFGQEDHYRPCITPSYGWILMTVCQSESMHLFNNRLHFLLYIFYDIMIISLTHPSHCITHTVRTSVSSVCT